MDIVGTFFLGILVVSYNLVEEPGQIKEPNEIFLVQLEFNLKPFNPNLYIFILIYYSILVVTNSPDFLFKIFAKHYVTALRIASNTVNKNNKHNNISNALLGTSALNVKSWLFYNNMDAISNGAFLQSPHQKYGPFLLYYCCRCYMVPDPILYLIAA